MPNNQKLKNARQLALEVLLAVAAEGAYSNLALSRVLNSNASLPAAERERLRQAAARLGRELAERWEACPHAARLWMG